VKRPARFFCLLLLITALNTDANPQAQGSQSPPVPAEWLTHAERTDYRETPNYEDTLAYARKLAAALSFARVAYGTWWRERQRSKSGSSSSRSDSAARANGSGPGSVEASASSAARGACRPEDAAKRT